MIEQILAVQPLPGPPGVAVFAARGEIDHDSRRILQDSARTAMDDGVTRLVLDLSAVTFCDSGGLSLFVELHRRTTEAGGWVRLAGAQGMVLSVLKATNLDRMFVLYGTPEAALSDE